MSAPHAIERELKVEVRGLSKRFRRGNEELLVLDGLDLEIARGEFVCILGPSGCGKSTLLNVLGGFEEADAGSIRIDGEQVTRPDPRRIFVFQDYGIFPWATVRENIALGLLRRPAREREEIVARYVELIGLQGFEDSYPGELSGGMKQRVQIARSLALAPAVYLMDEPFAALDALTRDELYDEIQRILAQTKQTVLFITHNIREAVILGDRVVVMGGAQPGRIRSDFTVDLPRPRSFESPGVSDLISKTMAVLKAEPGAAEESLHG